MTSAGGICGSIGTVLSLLFVNIDRYLAIEFPFHNVKMISTGRAKGMVLSTLDNRGDYRRFVNANICIQ